MLPTMIKTARLVVAMVLALAVAAGCSECTGRVDGALKAPTFITTDSFTNVATADIEGTKQAFTGIRLQRNDDAPVEIVAVDDTASFTAKVNLQEGPNIFFGASIDGDGVLSAPAGPLTITLDTVVPSAPTFDAIDPNIVVPPGRATQQVTLTGTKEADCELRVVVGQLPLVRTAVTSAGTSFSFPVDVPLGEVTVTATCVDQATNASAPAQLTLFGALDTTAPAAPTVEPFANPIVIDAAATEAPLTLRGGREANTALTVDGIEVVPAAEGVTTWTFDRIFPLGQTTLSLRSVDPSANASEPVVIVVDVRQLPGAPVASPPALTNQAEMPLSGFCDEGSAVGIALTADEPAARFDQLALCDAEGFATIVSLIEGDNEYYLYAVDDAGLESVRVGPFTTVLDTVAPSTPVIAFPSCAAADPRACTVFIEQGTTSGPFSLAGTRDGDSAIVVDDVRIREPGSVDWSGQVTVAVLEVRPLSVRAVDPAGNVSPAVTVNVTGVAGLALPTVECLGPYRLSGTSSACTVLIPEVRRAIRGNAITLRGRKVAGSGVKVHETNTNTFAELAPSNALTWTVTFTGLQPGRSDFAVSVFNSTSESSEVGPFFLRRDEEAPAAPVVVAVADSRAVLADPPFTRELEARVTGSKDLDGDICVSQLVVSEATCPGGVCDELAFSDCLPVAAADGLIEWGCARPDLTCSPNVGLLPGVNRLCFESSDVVPFNLEVANPDLLQRQFVGNRSARGCIDIERAVDPVPSFLRPVEGTLIRPGPLRVVVAVDQPVDLVDGLRVCIGDGVATCFPATETSTADVWEATITIPTAASGTAVRLRADALSGVDVRGTATITTVLVAGSQLVTDFASNAQGHRSVGAYAPQVAVGPGQEVAIAWEDDCWDDLGFACSVRNTSGGVSGSGALTATLPPDIFTRAFVGGAFSRTINLSDDARAVRSIEPAVTYTPTGEQHFVWIDNGFSDPQGTLVHRFIRFDGSISPTTTEVDVDIRNPTTRLKAVDHEPALVATGTGEVVAVWWKQRDADPDAGRDTRLLNMSVYCPIECTGYANGPPRAAGEWSNPVEVSTSGVRQEISHPAVVADDQRSVWIAWNQLQGGRRELVLAHMSLDPAANDPDIQVVIASSGLDENSVPKLAFDDAGLVHVAWMSTTGLRTGVHYRVYDTVLPPETALGPDVDVFLGDVGDVSVVSPASDTAVITWAPALCAIDQIVPGVQTATVAGGVVGQATDVAGIDGVHAPAMAVLGGGVVAVVYEDESATECGSLQGDIRFDVIIPE